MSTDDKHVQPLERGVRNQVGIHLDLDALRLVEVSHGRIKDWLHAPYPAGVQPGTNGFAEFLKKTVADIAGIRHAPVWVVGPVPSLQVRFLSVPKVRPRQLSHLVYWTFRKEIPFDAAQVTFDYDVEGEVTTPGQARKQDVTAYTVAHADINRLKKLFEDAGLQLEGLMIPSFAMRSVFRMLATAPQETVVGLYAGEDASAIMFVKNHRVVAHRVFKTGMNAMLDVLRDRYPDWSTARAYQEMAKSLSGPSTESTARVSETVHAAFARLIQQVERSVSAYLVGRTGEEIKTIHVAGSLAGLPVLVKELGGKLGLNSVALDGFAGRAAKASSGPELTPDVAGSMAIALGAAMSDPLHTPNLLYTYVKREHEERVARTSRLLVLCGAVGLAVLVGANVMVTRLNRGLRNELAMQQGQIEKFAPYPDQPMILRMVAEAAVNSAQLKNMAQRCLPVAALNQLALQTPEDIRLVMVDLDMAAPASVSGRRGAVASTPEVVRILVDGVVAGETGLQQSKLASYIMRLEDSQLFARVALTRSEEGRDGRDAVLLFALQMECEPLREAPEMAALQTARKGVVP